MKKMVKEDGESSLDNIKYKKLLSFTSNVNNNTGNKNLFEPQVLLEMIITDLGTLEKRINLLENTVSAALGVAIEIN